VDLQSAKEKPENKNICHHSPKFKRNMDSQVDFEAPLQLRPDRRNSGKGHWNESEDLLLMKLVRDNQGKNWKQVAEHFVGRTDVQCLHRWQKVTICHHILVVAFITLLRFSTPT
jgi:hypothetical protein